MKLFSVAAALGLLVASVACSTAMPVTSSDAPASTCAAADAVLAGPSPFERALAAYVAEGSTPEVRHALDLACGITDHTTLRGEQAACTLLGVLLLSGEGTPRDFPRADALFRRSLRSATHNQRLDLGGCDDGASTWAHGIDSRSSACCGAMRGCPTGCEARCREAATELQTRIVGPLDRACAAGKGAACHVLASAFSLGAVVEGIGEVVASGDATRARALHARACQAGVGLSCHDQASYLEWDAREALGDYEAPLPASTERAIEETLSRACDLEAPGGCIELGARAKQRGDLARAELHWQRACALGATHICRELAARAH